MTEIINGLEQAFASIGLTTPTSRFLSMAAVGGIFEWYFRPFYSYNTDGNPKPWALVNPGDPTATLAPPGSTAVVLGLVFSLFI